MICELPAGATELHHDRVMAERWPSVDRLPIPPVARPFAYGPAHLRVAAALLAASPAGLTMAELRYGTGLGWDEAYAAVEQGLERRRIRGQQMPDRRSQGELVSGGSRYFVA